MKKRNIAIVLVLLLLFTSNSFASETNNNDTEQIEQIIDFIDNNYVGSDISREDLIDGSIEGIFDQLDPYSVYYSQEEYEQFLEGVSGNYSGIGAYITEVEEGIMITKPMMGSPSEKAGLLAEDIIIAVDGELLDELTFDQGINLIKGESGSKVILTIKRGTETFDVEVIREHISVKAVSYTPLQEMYPDSNDPDIPYIWYVDIDSFNSTVAEDFAAILEEAEEAGVKGLILDVRNNSGGYLDQVIEMCEMIIPEGTIISTTDKQGSTTTYTSEMDEAPFKLICLTNEYSASASEILVSAVKDSSAGFLIGGTTFGKGVVQMIYSLGEDIHFKLTVKEYFTRNGDKINGIGVEPHFEVMIPNYIEDTNKVYTYEQEDDVIIQIENVLLYLGLIDEADNFYDTETLFAVSQFQKDNELPVTGNCDYLTITALNDTLFESVQEFDPQLDAAIQVMYKLVY